MKEDINKRIEFQIVEVKILSFFENSLEELNLNQKEIERGKVLTKSNLNINEKRKTIEFVIEAIFLINKRNKKFELFGAKARNTFLIKDFKEVAIKDKNGKFIKPNILFLPLVECSISSLVGILEASKKEYRYRNIKLPYIKPNKFL